MPLNGKDGSDRSPAMNLLDVNKLAGKVVPRDDFGFQATGPENRKREAVQSNDNAAVALEMVSEAAAAIRELEEQSAHAVASARDLAASLAKELEAMVESPTLTLARPMLVELKLLLMLKLM